MVARSFQTFPPPPRIGSEGERIFKDAGASKEAFKGSARTRSARDGVRGIAAFGSKLRSQGNAGPENLYCAICTEGVVDCSQSRASRGIYNCKDCKDANIRQSRRRTGLRKSERILRTLAHMTGRSRAPPDHWSAPHDGVSGIAAFGSKPLARGKSRCSGGTKAVTASDSGTGHPAAV